MRLLRQRDFHTIMEVVEQLYTCQTRDACEAGIVQSLPRVMDFDVVHVSEARPELRHVRWTSHGWADGQATIPNIREIVARHMHEHPFLRFWNPGSPAFEPVALSDLVSRASWHDTTLYNEIYRPFRMEHMLGIGLPVPGAREVHVSGLRETRDFDDCDRHLLGLLAPHLAAAYRNAEAVGELGVQLAVLRQGLEANGRMAVVLGPGRRIRHMSERARDVLTAHFSTRWADRKVLPGPVDDWLRRQETALTADISIAPRRPFVTERDGRRLTIQALGDRGADLLLLSERKLGISSADIASLGLSPRETEVLAWLAHGKSNADIAGILGLSPNTIKHCLERVYAKLDVGTRAAATAIAVAAAGMHGAGPAEASAARRHDGRSKSSAPRPAVTKPDRRASRRGAMPLAGSNQ